MGKQGEGAVVGIGMVVIGAAMFVVFGYFLDVQTPVVGLRQMGAVIAVLGVVELAASWWSGSRRRRDDLV